MNRLALSLLVFALAGSCAAKETDTLIIWEHPSQDHVKTFYECEIFTDGNRWGVWCQGAEGEPLFSLQPGNGRELKDVMIGTPYGETYHGECRVDDVTGDIGKTYFLACDDTIFKNGFQRHHDENYQSGEGMR